MARISVEIDEDLKRRAKLKAAREQKSLTQVIEGLLTDWVEVGARMANRRRLRLGVYKLGTVGSLSRREMYRGLR